MACFDMHPKSASAEGNLDIHYKSLGNGAMHQSRYFRGQEKWAARLICGELEGN